MMQIFLQAVWTLIRLLQLDQSDLSLDSGSGNIYTCLKNKAGTVPDNSIQTKIYNINSQFIISSLTIPY